MTVVSKTFRFAPAILAVLGVLCVLPGCSKAAAPGADLPAPGEMRVLRMEPLGGTASAGDNLIPNGDLREWWAGAPAPTGFVLPPEGYSTITREAGENGRSACAQAWKKADRKAGQANRFYVEVPEVPAEASYEFSVRAQSVEGCTATFDVYEVQEGEKYKALVVGAPIIPAEATSPTWFKTPVTTELGGRLVILTKTMADTPPPGMILWHEWRLTPTGGA